MSPLWCRTVFQENGCDPVDSDNYVRMIELWFQFCMIWSICCSVDEEGRHGTNWTPYKPSVRSVDNQVFILKVPSSQVSESCQGDTYL